MEGVEGQGAGGREASSLEAQPTLPDLPSWKPVACQHQGQGHTQAFKTSKLCSGFWELRSFGVKRDGVECSCHIYSHEGAAEAQPQQQELRSSPVMKVFPKRRGEIFTSPQDGFDQRGRAQRLSGGGSPKLFLVLLFAPGSGTQSNLITLTVLPQQSSTGRPCRRALSLPGQELSQQHLVQKQGKTLPDF